MTEPMDGIGEPTLFTQSVVGGFNRKGGGSTLGRQPKPERVTILQEVW